MLESLAMGLSPMHPKDWEAIKAEYDEVEEQIMAEPRRVILVEGDKRVRCPHPGCKVGMTLTPQGVEMLLAQETKCREHGLPLEVIE